ncbi:MAG TPA: hypothetical protein ENJ73_04285 [Desulfobacterales bacterium]|nr:hypothetical protein [Desulfobacterales bacterium]
MQPRDITMTKAFFLACLAASSLCLMLASPVWGAGRQLTAGVNFRQEFDSNASRSKENAASQWTSILEPFAHLRLSTARRSLTLRYAPGLTYNHRLDDLRLDHRLRAHATLTLTPLLTLQAREAYTKTDDSATSPEQEAAALPVALSPDRARRRYWQNTFDVDLAWKIARDSTLTFGYQHAILDNRSLDTSDYQRHEPSLSLSYRWNTQWSGQLDVQHTIGDFDQEDDLVRHAAAGRLFYHLDAHRQIFFDVSRSVTDYDTGPDYETASFRLGYHAQLSATTSLTASAGWSVAEQAGGDDRDGFSYTLDFQRSLTQKASLLLAGEGGFTGQEFNGNYDGLSRFRSVAATVRLALGPRVDATCGVRLRQDTYFGRQEGKRERAYEGNAGLSWRMTRWYTLGLQYAYRRLDNSPPTNEYTDHRLLLRISFTRDIWRG